MSKLTGNNAVASARHKALFRCAALCLSLVNAWGSAGGEEIEEILVLGSNIPADLHPAVEFIDRETLERFGAASLTRVLASVGGLHIDVNAGRGSLNSLHLRGGDPNLTQIQIDGIPVNDPSNSRGGGYDIGALSAANIERIEILPVAASALYGSQALAGVVNIVTRQSAAGAGEISLSAGSRGGLAVAASTGGERWSVSGFGDQAGADADGSDYRSRGVAASFRAPLSGGDSLRISGRLQDSEARAFPDDSGGSRFAVSRELERRSPAEGQLEIGYTRGLAGAARLIIDGHYFEHREDIFTPAVAPGVRDPFGLPAITTDERYRRSQIRARYLSAPGAYGRLAAGLEWLVERGSNSGILDFGFFQSPGTFELDRHTASAFAQWQWLPALDWRLSLGARVARTEGVDNLTPSATLQRSFAGGGHTLHASYGEGYKLPSFYALGQPLVGNPALLEETSRSLQLGYRFAGRSSRLRLALFANEFENLIDFESGPPPRLVNRDRVNVAGADARIEVNLAPDLRLNGSYVYVDSKIEDSEARLRNRPRHQGALGLAWDIGSRWKFHLNARYVGKRLDSSIPTGDRDLSSYVVTDAQWQWSRDGRLRLGLAIDNLFDRRYQGSVGNPVAGTTVKFNLSYRWRPG